MQIMDVFRKMKKKGFRIFFCSGFACQDWELIVCIFLEFVYFVFVNFIFVLLWFLIYVESNIYKEF